MAKKVAKKAKVSKTKAVEKKPVKVVEKPVKTVEKPVAEKKVVAGDMNIKNQLYSFIPEVIIMALGLAAIIIMFINFLFARAFVRGETAFSFYGELADLMLFDICLGVAFAGGVANLLIYAFYSKRDNNKIPHHITLATSIIYIIVALTLSLVVFAF